MAKVGVVVGGYLAAILLAVGVVLLYINQTNVPDRDASSAMYAFGDALLFVAVFGIVSTIPTGVALVFLRRSRKFWIAFCVVALVMACTSLGAVAVTVLDSRQFALGASFDGWATLSVLRILVSPFIALSLGLSAMVAPRADFRWYLFGTAFGVSSVYGFFHWFAPLLFQ